MSRIVEQALGLWGLEGARFDLVAQRENRVFRVYHSGGTVAMRLHRPGLRRDSELRSELQWMEAVGNGGVDVPRPLPALDGTFVQSLSGVQVDVLTWLDGAPIGATNTGLTVANRASVFHAIGHGMARLHAISDAWRPPQDFDRRSWNTEGLVGEFPVWDRFWDNPTLDEKSRTAMLWLRDSARRTLTQIGGTLDYGLIHADLVRENVILNGDKVQFIDFDDGGFGFRLFDLATTLVKNLREPDYNDLKASLIAGYTSVRPIDLEALDLFIALRAATYVGWIITRMDEDDADERNKHLIGEATALVLVLQGRARMAQGRHP